MGRNGFILWVQEEGPEWPEQGSKRKRLEGRFFFFFCFKVQLFGGGTSPGANRAASVVMNFLKFGRLVH